MKNCHFNTSYSFFLFSTQHWIYNARLQVSILFFKKEETSVQVFPLIPLTFGVPSGLAQVQPSCSSWIPFFFLLVWLFHTLCLKFFQIYICITLMIFNFYFQCFLFIIYFKFSFTILFKKSLCFILCYFQLFLIVFYIFP